MIKSIVVNNENRDKRKYYPILLKHSNIELVILFSEPKTGTVVYSTDRAHPLGCHKDDWIESLFSVMDDDVVLRNV